MRSAIPCAISATQTTARGRAGRTGPSSLATMAIRVGVADRARMTSAIEATLGVHTIGSIWLVGVALYPSAVAVTAARYDEHDAHNPPEHLVYPGGAGAHAFGQVRRSSAASIWRTPETPASAQGRTCISVPISMAQPWTRRSSCLRHKVADHRAERVHIHEEGVVPANAVERGKLRVFAHSGNPLR